MARLVFGMNQSLDGYVDHTAFVPNPTLFRHFIEEARAQAMDSHISPGRGRRSTLWQAIRLRRM